MNHSHNQHHHKPEDAKSHEDVAFCPVMENMPIDKEEAKKEGRIKKI